MLFALPRFFRRPPAPAEANLTFIQHLQVEPPREPRSRRSELVLGIGWLLVLAKCVLVWWTCHTYSVPVHPAWVIIPTLLGAILCTVVYWRRF
jgi:hypothetical protein